MKILKDDGFLMGMGRAIGVANLIYACCCVLATCVILGGLGYLIGRETGQPWISMIIGVILAAGCSIGFFASESRHDFAGYILYTMGAVTGAGAFYWIGLSGPETWLRWVGVAIGAAAGWAVAYRVANDFDQ